MRFFVEKKGFLLVSTCFIALLASAVYAFNRDGVIPDTSLVYQELTVSKEGVSVVLVNSSDFFVRTSNKLFFLDDEFNIMGETFFAIREIGPHQSVRFTQNHLKGDWKKIAKAKRTRWEPFTYEESR